MAVRHLFLLLLLPLLSFADDSAVMLKLLSSLSPAPAGWAPSIHFCNWTNVNCDTTSTFVTAINLDSASVSGILPLELNSLTMLKSLALQKNSLSGTLPSFENMTSLEQIYLDFNGFTLVPRNFLLGLTSLRIFSISGNHNLSLWEIPSYLSESSNLVSFYASNASITGVIPDIFGSFPNLQNVRLSYNNLTGALPGSFAGSEIQNLWLNNQQQGLSGTIDVLSSMSQLSQVWLHSNSFSGGIPDLSKCVNLFDLQLRDNRFTGTVPVSLMNLPNLVNITLQNNKLQGPYPQFSGKVHLEVGTTNSFCLDKPGPCDPQVTVLLYVAAALGYPLSLAEAWQGNNACQDWRFINCDSQGKNVTVVNMAKQQFSGSISTAFANLTYLRTLILSDNNLTGTIPSTLVTLSQLQSFDVSNNNLSGPIPLFPPGVRFISNGNPFLGKNVTGGGWEPGTESGLVSLDGSSSGSSKSSVSKGMIAGVIVAVVVFVGVLLFVSYKCYMRKREKRFGTVESAEQSTVKSAEQGSEMAKTNMMYGVNGHASVPSELHSQSSGDHSEIPVSEGGNAAFSIQVLRQVTNNFSEENVLGSGGFGVVYKGELHDGTRIAVKRMECGAMGKKGTNEFLAEIAVLTKVRHRHLVALLGSCVNENEKLLVYEYMPQGTLAQHLFGWRELGYQPLTWKQRMTIALDVARGVEYLHSLAQQSFIHRDLKPSNILLSYDMRAKVADFGLVKNAPHGKYSVETRLAGTFGYLAPEYAATGRVTTKVDVYAYGVVLMEIITGRKALDETMPDEKSHLVAWFRRVLINKENIRKSIDPLLDPDDETYDSICKLAELAGHCTARESSQRPDMGHAVNVLGPLVEQWKPLKPVEQEEEEEQQYGIDLHLSLPQELRRWQSNEGTSRMFDDFSYSSQTQSSIPSKPAGFADSFGSVDSRWESSARHECMHHFRRLKQLKLCDEPQLSIRAKNLHAHVIKCGLDLCGPFYSNTVLDFYGKSGHLNDAVHLFEEMPRRDLASWASLFTAYNQANLHRNSLSLFNSMLSVDGFQPDHFIFASLVKACACLTFSKLGLQLHAQFVVSPFSDDDVVKSALVDLYAKCGLPDTASRVFDSILLKNLVSWTSLIYGYARAGNKIKVVELLRHMPRKNLYSWTALISGFVQSGHCGDAFRLFDEMRRELVDIEEPFVISSLIAGAASSATLEAGKQVHKLVVGLGYDSSLYVKNALIDMYAKCCDILSAEKIFIQMRNRDVVSWTSIIVGMAQHGRAEEALSLYDEMTLVGLKPNEVTFVGLIYACSHVGLVERGRQLFDSMVVEYGLSPSLQHYTCLVDLYSRSGHLEDAENVLKSMPFEPDEAAYAALLSSCSQTGKKEIGVRIANDLLKLGPKNSSTCVLMSNIFARAAMWGNVSIIRKYMGALESKRKPGYSCVDLGKESEVFYAGETIHPMQDEILSFLKELDSEMRKRGYEPDTSAVLHDMEEQEKERQLFWHSERVAVAYGLLKSVPGTSIRILKNLRVCGDCHMVLKYICSIVGREIVVRDASRFHHFKNGVCSCKDFW
ncbi:hypothetical protein F511_00783 [Dorcoceras hygrometricum]|nr:hypothetical protein F511_00783 [Dorcoceras hygrometricum]